MLLQCVIPWVLGKRWRRRMERVGGGEAVLKARLRSMDGWG